MPSEEVYGDSLGNLPDTPSFDNVDFSMNDETGRPDVNIQASGDTEDQSSEDVLDKATNRLSEQAVDPYEKRYKDLQSHTDKRLNEMDKALAVQQERENFLIALLQQAGQPVPSDEDWADIVSDKQKFDQYQSRNHQILADSIKQQVMEHLAGDERFAKIELTMGMHRMKAQMATDGVDAAAVMPLVKYGMQQSQGAKNFDQMYDELKQAGLINIAKQSNPGGSRLPSEAAIKARSNRLNVERNGASGSLPSRPAKESETFTDPRRFNTRKAIEESINEALDEWNNR